MDAGTGTDGRGRRGGAVMLVARLCVVMIIAVWVLSGIGKVLDLSGFVNIVSQHRVLPQSMYWILWGVGPAELVMGLVLVFAAGSELTKPFGRAALVVSLLGVTVLSVYLSLVDGAVIRESGCGCLESLKRIDFGIDQSERAIKLGINGGLIAMHLIALLGPALARRCGGGSDRDGGKGVGA